MSSREEQIEALREVFKLAKNCPKRKSGRLDDLDLHGELQDAFIDVRKKGFYELKDEVYPYITDKFEEYRQYAVQVLGGYNGLHLPEFKEIAHKIWLEDPAEEVKVVALDSWAEYYEDTKDPIALKYLYNVFRSEQHPIRVRVHALYDFMNVADAFTLGEKSDILYLSDLENNELLTKAIDWYKIYRIMDQYVPDWKK